MNNKDLKEITPVYIHEASCSSDDEISLVALAMVLVRRKGMIAVITALIIAVGLIAALLIPKSYTFSTSIEIGSQIIDGTTTPFESPQTLVTKIQYAFIPHILNEHRQTNPEDEEEYKIISRVPNNSTIIVLQTEGTEDKADLLKNLLHSISQKATLNHGHIYESAKNNITSLLNQAVNDVSALKKSGNNVTGIGAKQKLIESYSTQLASLRNTNEISPPMKSLEPTGTSRKLIVLIAAFAGISLGVLSAFFAEFIATVRETSKQNED